MTLLLLLLLLPLASIIIVWHAGQQAPLSNSQIQLARNGHRC
jgi:hypothetical protein